VKLAEHIAAAYAEEPALKGTAFGIAQAVTRAAQTLSAEIRFELGKRRCSSEPVRTASPSAWSSTLRFTPRSSPTPTSVKRKPSWIGVNSAMMTMTKEKPGSPQVHAGGPLRPLIR